MMHTHAHPTPGLNRCEGFYEFDPEAYGTFVSAKLAVSEESVTITVVEEPAALVKSA